MDISLQLQDTIASTLAHNRPVRIVGGGSKEFYGNTVDATQIVSTAKHVGIIEYEPSELYITARSGTPLEQIESTLTESGQMLAFEPPCFSPVSTIGGVVAAGLSGPARPWLGSLRDHLLGTTLITGYGQIAEFGGQVMKNVAGYDVSRLMAGSLGTLGLILDVSLKVVPRPESELTTALEMPLQEALEYCVSLRRSSHPITGVCYFDDCLYIRLHANERLVNATLGQLGGEIMPDADEFWQSLRNQSHEFFQQRDRPLWRLSLPPATLDIPRLEGHVLIDWAGAQRWVYSNLPTNIMRGIASKNKGHVTLYRGKIPGVGAFYPLPEALQQLHKQLKRSLDPYGIFNPGRMYQDW